jgi:hypothetical protein
VRWAALVLLALALTGCETTAEQSARLERAAKAQQRRATAPGLSIARKSTKVLVSASTVLHSSEGDAAVLTLRNVSGAALVRVPVEITLASAQGSPLYTNDAPGLAAALTSAALLPAHSSTFWIDDQITASGVPASVTAKIGEGTTVGTAIQPLAVEGSHLVEESAGSPDLEGRVVNRASASQQEVVVDALARRGRRIVAAGRAVLAQLAAGATARFQLFFIGDPKGAQIETSAYASAQG